MVDDIQKAPIDGTSTPQKFIKSVLLAIILLGITLFFYIQYIVDKASYLEAFIFGTLLYLLIDLCFLLFFTDAQKHMSSFVFDTVGVGGVTLVLSLWLYRDYGKALSSPLALGLLTTTTVGLFVYSFYHSYQNTQKKLKTKIE